MENDYKIWIDRATPIEEDEYNEAIRVAENCINWIKNKIT
jgi:hypothetical protein